MTQAGFITTDQYEMLQKWEPMIKAAGLWSVDMHPFSSFLLAKKILNYICLVSAEKHLEWLRQNPPNGKDLSSFPPSQEIHLGILERMSPTQKEDMRNAINAECVGSI